MPSLEVREFAQKIHLLSLEDKQWLLQQLNQQIILSSLADINDVKKTFNISPAVPGSGCTDTAINHDEILANYLSGEL